MYLLSFLTALLPVRAQPYAKAIWPAVGTAVAVVVTWVETGEFNGPALRTAIVGCAAALLTFLLPNRSVGADGSPTP